MTSAVLAFDTLKFSDSLKAAGVAAPQAEAQARALAGVLASSLDALATRDDLQASETGVRGEIKQLATELRADLRESELRLRGELAPMKWMLATVSAGMVALVFSMVGLLFRLSV